MLILAILILVVLGVAAYMGYEYFQEDEIEQVEEPIPFHSTPEKSALPPRPQS